MSEGRLEDAVARAHEAIQELIGLAERSEGVEVAHRLLMEAVRELGFIEDMRNPEATSDWTPPLSGAYAPPLTDEQRERLERLTKKAAKTFLVTEDLHYVQDFSAILALPVGESRFRPQGTCYLALLRLWPLYEELVAFAD